MRQSDVQIAPSAIGHFHVFSTIFLGAVLLPVALIKAMAHGLSSGQLDGREDVEKKVFYSYIPLMLAGFIAFELHFVPGVEKLSLGFSLSNFRGADKVILEWPFIYCVNFLALGIGLIISGVALGKLMYKWKAKGWKYKLGYSGAHLLLMVAYAGMLYYFCWEI